MKNLGKYILASVIILTGAFAKDGVFFAPALGVIVLLACIGFFSND